MHKMVELALLESGIAFDSESPKGLGSGHLQILVVAVSPGLEVLALVDGDFTILYSPIILEYLDEKCVKSI